MAQRRERSSVLVFVCVLSSIAMAKRILPGRFTSNFVDSDSLKPLLHSYNSDGSAAGLPSVAADPD